MSVATWRCDCGEMYVEEVLDDKGRWRCVACKVSLPLSETENDRRTIVDLRVRLADAERERDELRTWFQDSQAVRVERDDLRIRLVIAAAALERTRRWTPANTTYWLDEMLARVRGDK